MLKYSSKQINLLVGGLLVQAAVFGFLLGKAKPEGAFQGTEKLLTTNLDQLTKIVIESKDKKSVEFTKDSTSWKLPAKFNVTVSNEKWNDTLGLIAEAKKSWPVGTTSKAAKQFLVSEDSFERKITFYKGSEAVQTVFLGNSPSFKKVYVRNSSEDVTYTVDLSLFDLPTEAKDWLDKKAHKIERPQVSSVVFDQVTLEQKDGNLVVQGLKEKEEANQIQVNALAQTALNPPYQDIVGEGPVPSDEKLVLKYTVHTKDNQTREFKFFEKLDVAPLAAQKKPAPVQAPKAPLIMTVSGESLQYEVSREQISNLLEASRNQLVKSNG